jgi:hypothetical protein
MAAQEEISACVTDSTYHRGCARLSTHAMLSGTRIKPPQLDEFFSIAEAPLRASEFAGLGWTEETVWGLALIL